MVAHTRLEVAGLRLEAGAKRLQGRVTGRDTACSRSDKRAHAWTLRASLFACRLASRAHAHSARQPGSDGFAGGGGDVSPCNSCGASP